MKATSVSQKVQEARLRWFGHVMRREEGSCEGQIMDMEVGGRRKRGRPRTGWKDCVVADGRGNNLDLGMAEDTSSWRRLAKNSDPAYTRDNNAEQQGFLPQTNFIIMV